MVRRPLLDRTIRTLRRVIGEGRPSARAVGPAVCAAEVLEERVLFALASQQGASGYSGTLSSNVAIRKQELICDPAEPKAGSTSVSYDASKVSVAGVQAGPGYSNANFCAFVEVQAARCPPVLQPLKDFLYCPAGKETGFVQVRYKLSGTAGQMCPPSGYSILDAHEGLPGVDTHAILFNLCPGVSTSAKIDYQVFAARAGTHAGNPEDFLVTNDGTNTRLGPDRLLPAFVSSQPAPPSGAELRPDPSDASKKALFVTGTNGPDTIRFQKAGNNLTVLINGASAGSFTGFTRVIAYGLGGNDDIQMAPAVGSYSTVFFGGDGDDKLVAGNGPSILVGGEGRDTLTGGNGGDLLVGGGGADTLDAGNGDDLLVADRTTYDAGSNDDIRALTRALNGSAATVFVPGTTVSDDGAADNLKGGNGKDWFLFKKNGPGVVDLADVTAGETAKAV